MSKFHRTDWDLLPELAFRPRTGWRGSMTLEGGSKSSDAAAPDPRLVEAQIKSLGVQDSLSQQIMSNANELAPLQKEQMQFGLDTAKEAYSQSQEDRQWALTRRTMLSGLQDKMVADAAAFDTDAKREELAGQAMGDVNRAFSAARGQSARDMASMGINPADGAWKSMDRQTTVQQALGTAAAGNAARTQARAEGQAMTDRATNALAGYPAMGMSATGAGAGYGSSGITIANTGLAGMNSGLTSAAQVVGQMGTNATGMFGAQASYKNGQDNISAGSGNSAMGAIGTVAGAAIMAF